ncbi:MAG: enoyl-CoA hydratase-related protein [Bacteroidota bacterium]
MTTATTYKNILSEVENGILKITVNRPDKLNALNHLTIREIGMAVESGANDSSVVGMIITGMGDKAFVAGADISEFANYSAEEGKKLSLDGQKVFSSIERCPKPVIAAVNGFALGGGCELAMSCHMRIASDNAKFGQPEVKLGLIPGYGGTQRMVQLIGKGKTMELLMTSDMIDAATALQLGLVNDVTTREMLIEKCKTIINKVAAVSPVGVAAIVKCVDAYYAPGVDGFNFEAEEFGKCFAKDDVKEGVSAFLEKRKANFKR